jgi:hypothetical protein
LQGVVYERREVALKSFIRETKAPSK